MKEHPQTVIKYHNSSCQSSSFADKLMPLNTNCERSIEALWMMLAQVGHVPTKAATKSSSMFFDLL